MADACSFDIVSDVDLQEVDNAVNQAKKDIQLRYGFRGSKSSFELDREKKKVVIHADDGMKLLSMQTILREKMVKRGVNLKALKFEKEEKTFGESIKQDVLLQVGIAKEQAKILVQDIKNFGFKVQASIQGEQIRVSGKKIDDLQDVIHALKSKEYDFSVQFVNFRR